jgi:hypothetical protein
MKLRHAIAPAAADGLHDYGWLAADVIHHRFGALAGVVWGGLCMAAYLLVNQLSPTSKTTKSPAPKPGAPC